MTPKAEPLGELLIEIFGILRQTGNVPWETVGAFRKGAIEGDDVKTIIHRASSAEVFLHSSLSLIEKSQNLACLG